jgi:addiction module HigA family antidote
MLNNRKRRPTHPGEILREDVLPETGLTQGEFAERLGVTRKTVNEILCGRSPVTVDMAHRLARALNTSPDLWLRLQQDVDIWDALEAKKTEYARIKPLATGAAG